MLSARQQAITFRENERLIQKNKKIDEIDCCW